MISLAPGTGWGAARNAGLKRSPGRDRPGDGRLRRGDRRRPRSARGRARRSRRRRRRSVRHRDARSPSSSTRRRGRAVRRDRGLLHGVPARDPHVGRPVRREVPLVPHGRYRVLVPRQGPGLRAVVVAAPGERSRASDVVRDATRPSARGGRSGTSTGSSIAGAIDGTSVLGIRSPRITTTITARTTILGNAEAAPPARSTGLSSVGSGGAGGMRDAAARARLRRGRRAPSAAASSLRPFVRSRRHRPGRGSASSRLA